MSGAGRKHSDGPELWYRVHERTGTRAVNVLAIGAHPDDVELYCAGTLAKYARQGHSPCIAVICSGDSAALGATPDETARIREQDSKEAAALIGADIHHLRYPDHRIPTDDTIKNQLIEIMRLCCPQVIITHDPNDCYTDHKRTSALVEECIYMAGQANIETQSPPIPQHPYLFYMDTVGGLHFDPHYYVDITSVFDMKRKMLACHSSLTEQTSRFPWGDLAETMDYTARFRGMQAGVRYAEAFRFPREWTWQITNNPLP